MKPPACVVCGCSCAWEVTNSPPFPALYPNGTSWSQQAGGYSQQTQHHSVDCVVLWHRAGIRTPKAARTPAPLKPPQPPAPPSLLPVRCPSHGYGFTHDTRTVGFTPQPSTHNTTECVAQLPKQARCKDTAEGMPHVSLNTASVIFMNWPATTNKDCCLHAIVSASQH